MDIVQLHIQNNEDTQELFKGSSDPYMTSMVWTHAYGLDHVWGPQSVQYTRPCACVAYKYHTHLQTTKECLNAVLLAVTIKQEKSVT